jgi:Integron cassette protein VCH_CASS1 chain
MPTQIADIDRLQEYLEGVLSRADHHANNVSEIALSLVGSIIWRKDAAPIQVMDHNGKLKNALWVSINGSKYVFSYSHEEGAIQIRKETLRGNVVHSLTNSTSAAELRSIFEGL